MTEKLTKLMGVMERKQSLTISEQLDLLDEIKALLAREQEAKYRIRASAQTLIAEVGADGPQDLEDVVPRVAAELHVLRGALAAAKEDYESLQGDAAEVVRAFEEPRRDAGDLTSELESAVETMKRGGIEGWWRK